MATGSEDRPDPISGSDTAAVSPSSAQSERRQRHSCVLCSRRKVKCDKHHPCSACTKAQVQCVFSSPAPSRRHKRKYVEEDVYARLRRYEDLLKKNNIDTSTNDGWIHYGVESRAPREVPATSNQVSTGQKSKSAEKESNLWVYLSDELRNPSQDRLAKASPPPEAISPNRVGPAEPSPDGNFLLLGSVPPGIDLASAHPRPSNIFRLWQIFLNQIHPLTKVIHAPTVQQQILEASDDIQNIPKELEALMFVIYYFAAHGLKQSECENLFGEDKSVLVSRYCTAAQKALIAADFISSSSLTTLQAFVLFLFATHKSNSLFILAGVALRIGQRLNLTQVQPGPGITPFESEMRLRLWWQIAFLDLRASRAVGLHSSCSMQLRASRPLGADLTDVDDDDVRLPLNVNDSDLYPEMSSLPIEHSGPTEMIYCLMKYDAALFLRHSPTAAPLKGRPQVLATPALPMAVKDKILNELEDLFNRKYLRYCDPRIPLHLITMTMAGLAISRLRFLSHHPRQYPDGQASLSREENDMLFAMSVKLLQLDTQLRRIQFLEYFPWHGNAKGQLDAFIYALSDLRRRTTGEIVSNAWEQVEILFEEHPELITDRENSLYSALRELTLSAWEARKAELVRQRQHDASDTGPVDPNFITQLLSYSNNTQLDSHHNNSTITSNDNNNNNNNQTPHTDILPPENTMSIPAIIQNPPHRPLQRTDHPLNSTGGSTFLDFQNERSAAAAATEVGLPMNNNDDMDWTYWEDLMQGQNQNQNSNLIFQSLDGDYYGRPFFEQNRFWQ
ncbi:transcriptional regulator family: Fungal Specific TF [Paecilomyces variotii]|nr:transcriptional regulator family: Fungal Specific TF [Paecilomyces variotii]KAJ9327526.1 transcriptional regulator family: Fungal Specific TF [Paecilomyces variotii]KAJ9336233.1 transcriptional regulator family: Fungal Specific TF [Paecilomyces variotii]